MPCRDDQLAMAEASTWPNISVKRIISSLRSHDGARPTSVSVFITSLLVLVAFLTITAALRYTNNPIVLEPFDGIEDMVLVYLPSIQQINQNYLAPYVSSLDENGDSREWLFDTFLFISLQSDNHKSLWESSRARDWNWWIDRVFAEGHQVEALDDEVGRVKGILGENTRRGVIISVPYPSTSVSDFGMNSRDGENLNFDPGDGRGEDSLKHRLEACTWFVEEVAHRWQAGDYQNLELIGFYWMQEELMEGDAELVNNLCEYLHEMGYPLYWIPYNSEANMEALEKYQEGDLGFEYIWIQPNYAFRDRTSQRWRELWDLDITAQAALEYNISIEIEVDRNEFLNGDIGAINSFYHYLDGGLTHLYIDRPLAYYVFPADMYWSRNSLVRQSYDALCDFVNGRHEPINYNLHCNLSEGDLTSSNDNIRLVSMRDWGRVEKVYGTPARMAAPGAVISIDGLDPDKDLVLAVKYLSLQEGSLEVDPGAEERLDLGKMVADGYWHTGHWGIELSRWSSKNLRVYVTNLTWISDIWVYPDETTFRLQSSDPDSPGLFTGVPNRGKFWQMNRGSEVLLSNIDTRSRWLVGMKYRSGVDTVIDVSDGALSRTIPLVGDGNVTTRVFTIDPHKGSGDVLLTFEGPIELVEMWASRENLHTNVGTDWDTNPHRHSPGMSIGEGWSAPRWDRVTSTTYRSGNRGSTMFLNPIGGDSSRLTIRYRSPGETRLLLHMGGSTRELVSLPPSNTWKIRGLEVPMVDESIAISVSGEIDVANLWIE